MNIQPQIKLSGTNRLPVLTYSHSLVFFYHEKKSLEFVLSLLKCYQQGLEIRKKCLEIKYVKKWHCRLCNTLLCLSSINALQVFLVLLSSLIILQYIWCKPDWY